MCFCIFAYIQMKNTLWVSHVRLSLRLSVYMLVILNQPPNRFGPNVMECFSKTPRPAVFISSRNPPSHLVTSTAGSTSPMFTGSIRALALPLFCPPSPFLQPHMQKRMVCTRPTVSTAIYK